MQHTIISQNVDGYEIVRAFGEATVDPQATWAAIQDKVLALAELAAVNACKSKMATQATAARNAAMLAESAKNAGNTDQYTTYTEQVTAAQTAISELETELQTLEATFLAARMALFEADAVYCTPGPGEAILSDTDYATKKAAFDALGDNTQLLLGGGTVVDFRGDTYWTKTSGVWASTIISTLGVSVPDGSVLESALTDTQKTEIADQVEAARIAALTDAAKLAEAQGAQAAVKTSAAQTYQEDLITGTDAATALSDSQTQYKAALAAINTKYGTSLS